MTREELIEVMARAILRDYEDGADMSTHPVPERAATRHALAALAALEAAGARLVPVIPTWPIIKMAQCSVEAYDKMLALSPYAPLEG